MRVTEESQRHNNKQPEQREDVEEERGVSSLKNENTFWFSLIQKQVGFFRGVWRVLVACVWSLMIRET